MKPIAVIGEGGHSKVVQDVIRANGNYQLIAILDDKYKESVEKDHVLYGSLKESEQLINEKTEFIIAIGSNQVRQKIASQLTAAGAKFATIIHPSASVSPSANIGAGTAVMAGCVINADAVIGRHVIINSSAVVEHDNIIEDYAHISPGAILTGNVLVGEGSQVGAGAAVIPGIQIGSWSVVGAGAAVISRVADHVIVAGVPAKII